MVDKVRGVINLIKIYNLVTDLDISYNIDRNSFIVMDKIENKLLRGVTLSINEFQEFIFELSKLSLWDSDYEMELIVKKY